MTGSGSGPPLVLVAHGSRDPQAATRCAQIAAEVRATWAPDPGPEVHLCYLDHGSPRPADVLDALPAGPAVLVPLLLATAYHVTVDLEAIATRARDSGRPIAVAEALVPYPLLLDAALALLTSIDSRGGIVLAAAGTSDPAANALTATMASDLAGRLGRPVLAAFAAGPLPPVDDAIAMLRRTEDEVAVLPWVLAPGRFATAIAATAAAASVPCTPLLGTRPEIAATVRARYDNAPRPRC